MCASALPLKLAVLLISGHLAFGQNALNGSRPAPHLKGEAIYESFFRIVRDLKTLANEPQVLNEKHLAVRIPRLQDVVGLTDSEVNALNGIASDCLAKVDSLVKRPSILQDRIERIESGEVLPSIANESDQLENKHKRLIADHINKLKAAFGDKRFKLLDNFVRSDKMEDLAPVLASPDRL